MEVLKTIKEGELTEGKPWEIIKDYECDTFGCFCYHVKPGNIPILPRGVKAYNEGHYSFTVVCLDCILELKLKQ